MMVLSSPTLPALIKRLLNDYDRVIVDSAPVNMVSDTLLMAKYFSGVCLVVRNGKTPRPAAERAVWLLEQSSANIVGTILNRLPRVTAPLIISITTETNMQRRRLMG
jgi:Mrp family chromosome partitioning ATPase